MTCSVLSSVEVGLTVLESAVWVAVCCAVWDAVVVCCSYYHFGHLIPYCHLFLTFVVAAVIVVAQIVAVVVYNYNRNPSYDYHYYCYYHYYSQVSM